MIKDRRSKNETLIDKLNYPEFFYVNKKAPYNFAIDFGICKFMKKNKKGNYIGSKCYGCYSSILLNIYDNLRHKIERASTIKEVDMVKFEEDIKKIKQNGIDKVRIYAIGDYCRHHKDILLTINKYLKTIILTKVLFFCHKEDFVELSRKMDKASFSISLNKNFGKGYISEIVSFIKENKLKNVNLNYCFLGKGDYEKIEGIDVYHTTSNKKLELAKIVGKSRTCCIRDKAGNITDNEFESSCISCNLCSKRIELNKYGREG